MRNITVRKGKYAYAIQIEVSDCGCVQVVISPDILGEFKSPQVLIASQPVGYSSIIRFAFEDDCQEIEPLTLP
jgi:hypothetical protein